jgi:hypothetical protein
LVFDLGQMEAFYKSLPFKQKMSCFLSSSLHPFFFLKLSPFFGEECLRFRISWKYSPLPPHTHTPWTILSRAIGGWKSFCFLYC